MFPGYEVSSSFFDGVVNSYSPSIWEITLGVGGIAIALLLVTVAVRVLRFLPETLDDGVVDPHAAKAD
jgi:Ni/Fe-hydrogenase subunit HybB-like protein